MSTYVIRYFDGTPRQATVVFGVFLTAQVLDGMLTLWGIGLFGVTVEANVLIATTVEAIGPHRAVLSAKLLAIACGFILYRTASYQPLAIGTGLYVGVAVIPWLLIVSKTFLT